MSMLLGFKIFIVLAIITLLIPTGATLVLSSRISREEELKARKLSIREGGNNG